MCTIHSKNNTAKLCKFTYGIPGISLGSVPCFFLFLLCIIDLLLASKFESTLFANVSNLHISHQNLKTFQLVVTNEIEKIDYWM